MFRTSIGNIKGVPTKVVTDIYGYAWNQELMQNDVNG